MPELVTIFLCGDVMTGRGVDQILPYPCDPQLYESYIQDARDYVVLAEAAHGEISRPVDYSYIWGDALAELDRQAPDVRIINLETAVTRSNEYWQGKRINYRMSPENTACLTAASIDACALANNHVLDWGYPGLRETLSTLAARGIKTAGAGEDGAAAAAPALLHLHGGRRVVLFSFGFENSGIPFNWAAAEDKPGVELLSDRSDATIERVTAQVEKTKRAGDIVIASLHWGGNWGYTIEPEEREFARRLIDRAGIDVVHGHSSHHPKGIEVYRQKPILYGCGDFIDDYEGITGYEEFRADLVLMYFVTIDTRTGQLAHLKMAPMQTHRLRLRRPGEQDVDWLIAQLNRECARLGSRVTKEAEHVLQLDWMA